MSYRELINQSIGNVYQAGIATKILQHMGRIRNSSDENLARRWVMELLQNARDVAWPDSLVKVKLELSETELRFSHTGRPFRIQDILSIVNQVSSKVDDENTVGQFGTGFVTTFQLSEQVKLKGVLKDADEPYKPFEVYIDRQGFTKEEVLAGIERAMEVLYTVDEADTITDYDKEAFHTTFTYVLGNDYSRRIARIGIEDLSETICYVLLFSEKIGSVELKYTISGEEKTICYVKGDSIKLGDKLRIAEFLRKGEGGCEEKFSVCYMNRDGMTLAANYSKDAGFLPLSEKCARLFIDFPLVGAEKFCFPVVINDLQLQPNEPRSGISLVDNENSKDAQINKALIMKAVSYYKEFLAEALAMSLKGLNHIIEIPIFESNREISENWVKKHVYRSLYDYIITLPVFETLKGRKTLNMADMFILRGESLNEIESLKTLLLVVNGIYYPEDTIDWYQTFFGYEIPEEKVFSLEKLLDKAEMFIRSEGKVDEKKIPLVKWCEGIFCLAMKNIVLSRRIRAGEVAIFPSQKLESDKIWYLRKLHEIRLDPGIPETLKDVTEILDELEPYYSDESMSKCCIRENLLHQDFVVTNLSELMIYEWSKLGNYIEVKSNESFRIRNYQMYSERYRKMRNQAWIFMITCGPDEEMYELISQFWDKDIPAYEAVKTPLSAGVWKNSYHGLLRCCIDEINNCPKVENLRWYQSSKCPDIFKWLNLFYKKWMNYQYLNEDNGLSIYLNQEGNFRKKTFIERDRIEARELKIIAYGLKALAEQCNYYSRLLHEEIVLEDYSVSDCKNSNVAILINQVITQLLTQQNLADATIEQQESCSLLLTWIQDNPEEAKNYFPAYCTEEGLMKLLTPKVAARMQQRVHKLDEIIKLMGCKDEVDAMNLIQEICRKRQETEHNKIYEFLDGDVYLDGELFGELSLGGDEEKLRKICHEIGIAGEKYVLNVLKEYYLKQELVLVSESTAEIKLQSSNAEHPRMVVIYYPDSELYHQAGWDIRITDSDRDVETEYIEVKTHTKQSYFRNRVRLSNEQMKLAIAKKEHYHVLVAMYDWHARKGQEVVVYDGFLRHVQNGKLKNIQDGYIFSV